MARDLMHLLRASCSWRSLTALLLFCKVALAAAEEEEVRSSPVAIAISVMLMGSIGFQMLMFYLVNWPDQDIRRYSWQVISQTISIFCAVLLFQACNAVVEEKLLEGATPLQEVLIDITQMLVWLSAMQLVLAITSGAINELIGGEEPEMEKVELNVKSWSVLFSHVAGFATINAWGSIQQKYLNGNPFLTFLVVPLGYGGLHFIYKFFDVIREHIAHMDDGEEDEFEKKWDEETEEAENDVAGLSLSFLTVQAIRFLISGILPNQEGIESWDDSISHSGWQWHCLCASGIGFFMCSLFVLNLEKIIGEERFEAMERIVEILNNYFTFGMSWCFFYGARWAISSSQFTKENALLMVVIALFLSTVSFLFIFLLDKVEDNHLLGEDSEVAENAAERLIQGLGILIGFSWEQSFDTAVAVVAAGLKSDCPVIISKMVMSVCLVLIVFPAWRNHILPTERELSEETPEKAVLKQYAQQHYDHFVCHKTSEDDLDKAHLLMKRHRRDLHGLKGHSLPPGLKHLSVTSRGITEVDAPAEHQGHHEGGEHKKKKTGHVKELSVKLLDN